MNTKDAIRGRVDLALAHERFLPSAREAMASLEPNIVHLLTSGELDAPMTAGERAAIFYGTGKRVASAPHKVVTAPVGRLNMGFADTDNTEAIGNVLRAAFWGDVQGSMP